MYRCFTRRVGLGLIAFGCGSPGDLDRSLFPELEATGYGGQSGIAGAAAGGMFGGGGSGPGGAGVGGAGLGGAGVGGAGLGGSAPVGAAGGSVGGTGPGAGGQASGGQGGSGTSGAGGTEATGSCPDDITVLLDRPGSEGGCAGAGCHVSGGTPPDLTSPGVEARVFGIVSNCNGRPYVSADDSIIENKITATPPDCGSAMPLFNVNALNAEDKACIIEWIDELGAGL